jgi:hypothetical protein
VQHQFSVKADGVSAVNVYRAAFDIGNDKATVAGYHFGMPGAGTIKKDGNGYVFVPVKV